MTVFEWWCRGVGAGFGARLVDWLGCGLGCAQREFVHAFDHYFVVAVSVCFTWLLVLVLIGFVGGGYGLGVYLQVGILMVVMMVMWMETVMKGVVWRAVKGSLGVLGWGERWGLSEWDPLLLR